MEEKNTFLNGKRKKQNLRFMLKIKKTCKRKKETSRYILKDKKFKIFLKTG